MSGDAKAKKQQEIKDCGCRILVQISKSKRSTFSKLEI